MMFLKILFYLSILMGLTALVFGIVGYYVEFKPNGESFPITDTLVPFVAWWSVALIAKIGLKNNKK